jgi:hypothetical protein
VDNKGGIMLREPFFVISGVIQIIHPINFNILIRNIIFNRNKCAHIKAISHICDNVNIKIPAGKRIHLS